MLTRTSVMNPGSDGLGDLSPGGGVILQDSSLKRNWKKDKLCTTTASPRTSPRCYFKSMWGPLGVLRACSYKLGKSAHSSRQVGSQDLPVSSDRHPAQGTPARPGYWAVSLGENQTPLVVSEPEQKSWNFPHVTAQPDQGPTPQCSSLSRTLF